MFVIRQQGNYSTWHVVDTINVCGHIEVSCDSVRLQWRYLDWCWFQVLLDAAALTQHGM
jgi:hypothetical protein